MEQLRWENVQEKSLNRISGAGKTLLGTEMREELEKDKKSKDDIKNDEKNLFRLMKDKIIRDFENHSEQEKEGYYKPVSVHNFWSRNYIEYESNGDRNKTLSIEAYLNKFRQYLKDIINDLKKYDWKIQVIVAIGFIFSKDTNEERVMHSKSDNIIKNFFNHWVRNINER